MCQSAERYRFCVIVLKDTDFVSLCSKVQILCHCIERYRFYVIVLKDTDLCHCVERYTDFVSLC